MYETTAPVTEVLFEEKNADTVMQQSFAAFALYKKTSPETRAVFLEAIATAIESIKEQLVPVAKAETNLPEARLTGEIGRTTGQLRSFAALLREGSWVEASIDTADPARTPPKADIRKMLVPTGPVVVFGASNFPFAFSTAGGDTASALAAGCTVVIKGHPAHAQTSLLVYGAIEQAIEKAGLPAGTVQHVAASGNAAGKWLVQHPLTTGVGFTGSFAGGTALVEYARQREVPIPVFAEMSSTNPVVFYPDALEKQGETLANTYATSITLGAGQFCTNPGLLLGVKGAGFEQFLVQLGTAIAGMAPQKMLHDGIHTAYGKGIQQLLDQPAVQLVGQSATEAGALEARPVIVQVAAADFIKEPQLAEEVFGPSSMAIVCQDMTELAAVLQQIKGQLTTTLMATDADVETYADVVELQHSLAGRIILNQVPTGVEVCASMVHGGPFPATTDARFTSVGTTAIKRWVRPRCLQNFSDAMLPEALKNENPLGILRLVNNVYTRDAIQ